MNGRRETLTLVRQLEDSGATVTWTRSNHLRVQKGGALVFLASTPSDARSIRNSRALLRREGILR